MEAYARPSLYNLAPFNFTGVTLPRQFPAEHCSSPCHALTFTCRRKGHLHHHPVAPTQHQILWNCKGKGKNNEKNNVNLHLLCARCSTHLLSFLMHSVLITEKAIRHRSSITCQKQMTYTGSGPMQPTPEPVITGPQQLYWEGWAKALGVPVYSPSTCMTQSPVQK